MVVPRTLDVIRWAHLIDLLNFVQIMLTWSPKLSLLSKLGWSGTVLVHVQDITWSPMDKLWMLQIVAGSAIF